MEIGVGGLEMSARVLDTLIASLDRGTVPDVALLAAILDDQNNQQEDHKHEHDDYNDDSRHRSA